MLTGQATAHANREDSATCQGNRITHTRVHPPPHAQLVKRLFDIDVVAADGKAQVWHPDVRFFEIRAANGSPISYFYLDPYARPSEKRGGAWMNSVISRSKLMAPAGAAVRLPVALAVCNQNPPVGDAPSLMSLGQVRRRCGSWEP